MFKKLNEMFVEKFTFLKQFYKHNDNDNDDDDNNVYDDHLFILDTIINVILIIIITGL